MCLTGGIGDLARFENFKFCACYNIYFFHSAVCKPLGMESGKILDSAITASSAYSSSYVPHHGRLNLNHGAGGWAPASAKKDTSWIQVDLGDTMSVTGVATQGRCNCKSSYWVRSYTVSYSADGRDWEFLKESGSTKVGLLMLYLFPNFKFIHVGNLFFQ